MVYSSSDGQLLSRYHHSNWEKTSNDINNLNGVAHNYFYPAGVVDDDLTELREAELKIHAAAKMAKLNMNNDSPGAAAKLSGGETQRLGIARLIARNSAIFIFSEIMENINAISQGITTIMIAYR